MSLSLKCLLQCCFSRSLSCVSHSPAQELVAGWDEIARLKDLLEGDRQVGASRCEVMPLHSMVPSADQRKVFRRTAAGVRKVSQLAHLQSFSNCPVEQISWSRQQLALFSPSSTNH